MDVNNSQSFLLVKPGEIKLSSELPAINFLGTVNLGADIAITCFNASSEQVLLARTTDLHQLKNVLQKMLDERSICNIRLVGGDGSHPAKLFLDNVLQILSQIDQGKDIINIISADINDKQHPDSFCISAENGQITTL